MLKKGGETLHSQNGNKKITQERSKSSPSSAETTETARRKKSRITAIEKKKEINFFT